MHSHRSVYLYLSISLSIVYLSICWLLQILGKKATPLKTFQIHTPFVKEISKCDEIQFAQHCTFQPYKIQIWRELPVLQRRHFLYHLSSWWDRQSYCWIIIYLFRLQALMINPLTTLPNTQLWQSTPIIFTSFGGSCRNVGIAAWRS